MIEWQASLLDVGEGDGAEPRPDCTFAGLVRHQLDSRCWVDHVPGWLSGSDVVFETLVAQDKWASSPAGCTRSRSSSPGSPPPGARTASCWRLPVIEEMRSVLSESYEVELDSGGINFYRDGRDSVAWHSDRIPKEVVDPIVCIVSAGEPRKFLLRPKAGSSLKFMLGRVICW